jgi:microcystin degradation protein MlrC
MKCFAKISARIVYLGCPGSLRSNLKAYAYQHVSRPCWPMDPLPAVPWRVAVRSPHDHSTEGS